MQLLSSSDEEVSAVDFLPRWDPKARKAKTVQTDDEMYAIAVMLNSALGGSVEEV